MADQFLEKMHWTIWDLYTDLEVKEESARRKLPKSKSRELNVRPLTDDPGPPELDVRINVPRILLAGLAEPALFAVGSSTDTTGLADSGDVLLVELASAKDPQFAPDAVYLFLLDGCYTMRWARKGANCTYLLGNLDWTQPHLWRRVEAVTLIGRIHAIAKRQTGMFRRPVPPSGAN